MCAPSPFKSIVYDTNGLANAKDRAEKSSLFISTTSESRYVAYIGVALESNRHTASCLASRHPFQPHLFQPRRAPTPAHMTWQGKGITAFRSGCSSVSRASRCACPQIASSASSAAGIAASAVVSVRTAAAGGSIVPVA